MAIFVRHLLPQQTDMLSCQLCGKKHLRGIVELGGKHANCSGENPLYMCGTCHKEHFNGKECIFGGSPEYENYLEYIYLKEIMNL